MSQRNTTTTTTLPKRKWIAFEAGGGGDCFFLAVLASMREQWGTDGGFTVAALRKACAAHIRAHPEHFAQRLHSEKRWKHREIAVQQAISRVQNFIQTRIFNQYAQHVRLPHSLPELHIFLSRIIGENATDKIWEQLEIREKDLDRFADVRQVEEAARLVATPGFWLGHEAGDLPQETLPHVLGTCLVIHQPNQKALRIPSSCDRTERELHIVRENSHYLALR